MHVTLFREGPHGGFFHFLGGEDAKLGARDEPPHAPHNAHTIRHAVIAGTCCKLRDDNDKKKDGKSMVSCPAIVAKHGFDGLDSVIGIRARAFTYRGQ